MNLQYKGSDHPTDVLAFPLRAPDGGLIGDVYLCPWVASREAEERGISVAEEMIRLIVHGTLHVIGYDHEEGPGRTSGDMWARQEEYVRELT